MDTTKDLLLIESSTVTGRWMAQTAVAMGLYPILITSNPARYAYVQADHIDFEIADTTDAESLLACCRDLKSRLNVVGITSRSEHFVAASAAAACTLGFPCGDPVAIRECRDKSIQRAKMQQAGVRIPRFQAVESAAVAAAAGARIGLPVIVKPVSGSGSVGVRLCSTTLEVGRYADALLSSSRNGRDHSTVSRLLVEEYVTGDAYSVEIFNGLAVGVTKKHMPAPGYFVATGHDFPEDVSTLRSEALCSTALQAVVALELTWGPNHVELNYGEDGPTVIEVNPRLAGGMIPELVRLATGVDLVEYMLNQVTGCTLAFPAPKKHDYASIRFFVPPISGTVMDVGGIEDARSVDNIVEVKVDTRPGDYVLRRGDFRDRHGYVISCADNLQSAQNAADLAASRISVHVRRRSILAKIAHLTRAAIRSRQIQP